jgi:hypothetical protein
MAQKAKDKDKGGAPDTLMLAYLCIKDKVGLVEQVAVLDRFGLADAEIAQVCGVAKQSVASSRLKRKKRAQKNGNGAVAVAPEQEVEA